MKVAAGSFGLGIIGIIIAADTGHLGWITSLYKFPYGDKVGHFMLYGLLSLLVNLAVLGANPHPNLRSRVLLTCLMLAVPIGLEELSQRLFADRSSNVFDLAASYTGVLCFAWLAVQITQYRTRLQNQKGQA